MYDTTYLQVIRKYLTLQGREKELKQERDQEPNVISIMKDIVNLKNDAIKEDTRMVGGKLARLVNEAQKHYLGK